MEKLRKLTPELCQQCKYQMEFSNTLNDGKRGKRGSLQNARGACNYSKISGHSRIFVDGQMAYDPTFCDKFEPGEKIDNWGDFEILQARKLEEYVDYKVKKIRKEKKWQKNV